MRLGIVTLGVAAGLMATGIPAGAAEPAPPVLPVPPVVVVPVPVPASAGDLAVLMAKAPDLVKDPEVKAALDELLALPAVAQFQKRPPIFDLKGGLIKLVAQPDVAAALQKLTALPAVTAALAPTP